MQLGAAGLCITLERNMLVRLLTGKHRVGDRVYHPGEVFEATECELIAFGDKLQLFQTGSASVHEQQSLSESAKKPPLKVKRG